MIEIAPTIHWYVRSEMDQVLLPYNSKIGWDDADQNPLGGGAATTVITFDNCSVYKFDCGAGDTNFAMTRNYSYNLIPDVFRIELRLYHTSLGTVYDAFKLFLGNHTKAARFGAYFQSDGLFIDAGALGTIEVGTNLVAIGEWQTWTFDVDFSGSNHTVDIYLDGVLQQAGVNCTQILSYPYVRFSQNGTVANRNTYVDYLYCTDQYKIFTLGEEDIFEINSSSPMGNSNIYARGAAGTTVEAFYQGI